MTLGPIDYIVIGAGSAGCAIASRLSEDPNVRVLLLEAGGPAHWWHPALHIPAAKGAILKSAKYHWGYSTVPQDQLNHREVSWYQGKVLGGSSTINGMVFVRGSRADFDSWAEEPGLSDWSFNSLLPYFKRLETYGGKGGDLRGGCGPVSVQAAQGLSPMSGVFIEAGMQAGYPASPEANSLTQEGFGLFDMTVENGRRVTSWDAYIRPYRNRSNLTVLTGAQAVKLELENARCQGLTFELDGRLQTVFANREIIVSSGAIGSPALLLRSGIGPGEALQALGIEVLQDLPGVGKNLHDHLQISISHRCTQKVTLQPLAKRRTQVLTGLRWLVSRSGWAASNHFESGGFVSSNGTSDWPDIQFLFCPHAISRSESNKPIGTEGYQVHVGPQRPKSRGNVLLRSSFHSDPPIIDPNYLAHSDDWRSMRRALTLAREIFSQRAFDPYRGEEIVPGAEVTTQRDLDSFIRRTADSGYHPCGTCKMGQGGDAVVDEKLRVHGVEGLRVADASIIPSIPTGNINATSIMIGEKAADLIRES